MLAVAPYPGGESRAEFLRRSAKEREDRERKRIRELAATRIQARWRGKATRKAVTNEMRAMFDARMADLAKVEGYLPPEKRPELVLTATFRRY
ncbi:Ube3c, partial [Symbiodinium pilosum]